MKQVIDLRNVRATPITFGDAASERRYAERVREARARQAARGIRHAIAPLISLTTPRGAVLEAGSAVMIEDFEGGHFPAPKLLRDAVNQGRVLEVELDDIGPEAA